MHAICAILFASNSFSSKLKLELEKGSFTKYVTLIPPPPYASQTHPCTVTTSQLFSFIIHYVRNSNFDWLENCGDRTSAVCNACVTFANNNP